MADFTRKIAIMTRILPTLSFVLLAHWSAFAQTNPTAEEQQKTRQAQAAAQQQLDAQREAAERAKGLEAFREYLNSQAASRKLEPGAAADLDAKFLEFRLAIPKFRDVTKELAWNLSMKSRLDKDLKNLETQTDILLRYLTAAKINHPRPDAQEFKDFSPSELQWETLNVAEHIASFLDLAVAVERKNVSSTEALEFMYTLDGQLQRLKWLTSHVK